MLAKIPLAWKLVGVLGLVLALTIGAGIIYERGVSAGEAKIEAKVNAANLALEKKAEDLSNELVIQQAIAMGVTSKKATTYVQQIHAAPDDVARVRAASHGVRDIVGGDAGGAERSPDAAVPGSRAPARP